MAYLNYFCLVLLINIQGRLLLPNDRTWHYEKVYDDAPQEVGAAILNKDISHQIPVKKEMDISKTGIQVMARKDAKGSNMCPSDVPYAFKDGRMCCSTFQEDYWKGYGETCNGNSIRSTSVCCYGKKEKCSSCTNARVAYWTTAQVQEEFKAAMPFGTRDWRLKLSATEVATCLANMNMYRRKHKNTPDVVWDADLAKSAQDWAQHLMYTQYVQGNTNEVRHSPQRFRWFQGENIFAYQWDSYYWGVTCEDAQKAWYSEIDNWDFKNSKGNGKGDVHHFTAMVWKGVTKYGIGIAEGMENMDNWEYYTHTIIVGRYSPAPNVVGEERDNVMPLK